MKTYPIEVYRNADDAITIVQWNWYEREDESNSIIISKEQVPLLVKWLKSIASEVQNEER